RCKPSISGDRSRMDQRRVARFRRQVGWHEREENMKRLMSALFVTTAIAAPAWADGGKKVFFLLPNSTTIRFESRDAPFFVEAMKKLAPNAQVIVQNGQGDPARQQRLVEDAIAQGASVILLTSTDANLAAGELKAAEAAKVPVVLYDHDAIGGKAEA